VNEEALALLASDALTLALRVAAPALIACVVAALVLGFFQASMQAQDASIGFAPKLVAVAAALFTYRTFMGDELVRFSTQMFAHVAQITH
jgi:flagellar biosynthesis protein FliQ